MRARAGNIRGDRDSASLAANAARASLNEMRSTVASWFCIGGVVLAGCEPLGDDLRPCTEIGCSDSIDVTIDGTQLDWADGDYTLDLGLDTQLYHCTFALPVAGGVARPGTPLTPFDCAPALPGGTGSLVITPWAACPSRADAGRTLPQQMRPCQYSIQLQSNTAPATVTARLAHEGTVLLEEGLQPEYAVTMPNGPECEPTCRQSQVSFLVE